jgi:hypothetical protein
MSDTQRERPGEGVPGATDMPPRGSTVQRGSAVHEGADMAGHPDMAEMRERYARVLEGPRASAVDGLIVLTGLYTAISPWIVHFQGTNSIMTVNNLVIGLAMAALGLGMALRPMQMLRLGWAVSAMGVWLIISPWVASLGHSAVKPLIWNNAFVGGVAVVLGLAAMGLIWSGGERSRRMTARRGAAADMR